MRSLIAQVSSKSIAARCKSPMEGCTSNQIWPPQHQLDAAELRVKNALLMGSTDSRLHWARAVLLWQQGERRAAEDEVLLVSQRSSCPRSLALLPRFVGDALPSFGELLEAFVVSGTCTGEVGLMHPDDEYDVFVPEADCDGPLRFTEGKSW